MNAPSPVVLGPNQPAARPYRGGAGIRAFRGIGSTGEHAPEDFVASTTTVFGSDDVGLTRLPDGQLLRDAIEGDPEAWLGAAHVAAHGSDPGVLVKLLHTGERLFNHVHPDAAFANTHLGLTRGKNEAWIITSTGTRPTADVWLGFRETVSIPQLTGWFECQDTTAMLDALHHFEVRPGDWVFVPAGTPHSIGSDITLVELQEPTDLSIIFELDGFPALDPASALLGLDPETAFAAVHPTALTENELAALHGTSTDAAYERLLPEASFPFFTAERFAVMGCRALTRGYAVVVVLNGSGTMRSTDDVIALQRGTTVLIPAAVDDVTISGDVEFLRCAPPRA